MRAAIVPRVELKHSEWACTMNNDRNWKIKIKIKIWTFSFGFRFYPWSIPLWQRECVGLRSYAHRMQFTASSLRNKLKNYICWWVWRGRANPNRKSFRHIKEFGRCCWFESCSLFVFMKFCFLSSSNMQLDIESLKWIGHLRKCSASERAGQGSL